MGGVPSPETRPSRLEWGVAALGRLRLPLRGMVAHVHRGGDDKVPESRSSVPPGHLRTHGGRGSYPETEQSRACHG